MELRPAEAPPKPQTEPLHSPVHRRDSSARDETWFAAPLIAVVAMLCCAGPVLLAALAATGVRLTDAAKALGRSKQTILR